MHIIILSRSSQLYSTQSLVKAGRKKGHRMKVVDYLHCNLVLGEDGIKILYQGQFLDTPDAVIPRIGASWTNQGASVVKQFELQNTFTTLQSEALKQARNKLSSLQILSQNGINVPKTVFVSAHANLGLIITELGGLPVVMKLLESTHGSGVKLATNFSMANAILRSFQRLQGSALVQEFIQESNGADIRAFVVGGKVVASMKRQARQGEFRSNLHLGASATAIELSQETKNIVQQTVKILGLEVAGVDLLESNRGPLVMEVNASPGLEGIETVTGVAVAEKIIAFIEEQVMGNEE